MSSQHSSSISSENNFVNRRLRSLAYRNPYVHDYLQQSDSYDKINRYGEYISYSKDKRRRQENKSKTINNERSRRIFQDILSQYSDTDIEDEIDYLKQHHRSKSARNVSSSSSRRNRFYHSPIDVYQACQVTINYTKDSSSSKTDQILIEQKQNNNDKTIIVYKGYLKSDERFSFKSQHLAQYPFDIKFYVNGYLQVHFITCCEFKYRQGGFRINQLFIIQQIEKSIPCLKCQKRQHKQNEEILLNSSLSNHQSRKTNDQQENNHFQSTKSIDRNNSEVVEDEEKKSSENETNNSPKTENENNFSNEFRRMLIEQRTNDNEDNRANLFQSLLTLFQNGFRQTTVREPLPERYQGNVENFVVLLLGITDQSNLINSIFNFSKTFDNIESLNNFIETLKYEKLILIVNDRLIESIEDFTKFDSIYLLSNNKKWNNKSENIRGNYLNLKLIIEQIKNENNNFILIESISEEEKENKKFCYSQLLKEILLSKDNEGNLKKDFIDYSRLHYQKNNIQLNLIDEFEQDFTSDKSIWWFTRYSFIQKMINRALRTQEIDILFKIRWIIQLINQQIKENHFSNIVYRIVHLSLNEFNQLNQHLNGLISFGTFLDCTLNKPSSSSFQSSDKKLNTILFQIKTTNGIDIKQIRHSDSNIEILLSFDNIYKIEKIEQINSNNSIINLTLINKQETEQYQQITNEMRTEISGPVILIELSKLLILNDAYLHADYLARLLFNDNSLKDNPTLLASLAAVHHLLGSHDNKQNNHQAARLQFEQSLKIFLSFIPEDNQILSATYNNIGSMFYQEDQHDQAIIYHQKALQCQLKSSTPDIDAIATYSGNIGAVYLDQKKYDQALLNYKRSLQILQQTTPGEESQPIAMVYDRIASVYWRMDKPEEALPFYQKALQLELKYLPENDHKISVSYFNLSTAYAKLNRLDDAIDCAEKSVQQLLKSVPPDHPEVKENTEQLEGLRRRKWLQQLYQ